MVLHQAGFFLDSKKLSRTFTQRCNQSFSIFIMLELVFLNGFAVVGSKGGYFVNLLQFPSLCPLTSFCAAWNPTGPHKNITLIDHGKIQLAVDGIHILRCSIWILHRNLEFGCPKIYAIAIYEIWKEKWDFIITLIYLFDIFWAPSFLKKFGFFMYYAKV